MDTTREADKIYVGHRRFITAQQETTTHEYPRQCTGSLTEVCLSVYFLINTFAATDNLVSPINVHRQVPLTSILVIQYT